MVPGGRTVTDTTVGQGSRSTQGGKHMECACVAVVPTEECTGKHLLEYVAAETMRSHFGQSCMQHTMRCISCQAGATLLPTLLCNVVNRARCSRGQAA
jgi:hypothetical protein